MDFPTLLPFTGAALGGAVAIAVAIRARRSVPDWALAAGLVVLAADCVLIGFSARAPVYGEVMQWQEIRLALASVLPGIWLLFSLTYARGNAQEFVRRWIVPLALAFVVPLALVAMNWLSFISTLERSGPYTFLLKLRQPGVLFEVAVLIGAVLVLMNLERTFRASVGTLRWRIKFMLLGVGILFIARAYTCSQTLLYRSVDPALGIIESTALIFAAPLLVRSLIRSKHFALDVYPSQSVLQGSLTILLAGIYLLVVGVFAKVVARWGGDTSFAIKTFVVLLGLVLLTVLLQSDRVRLQLRRFVSRNFERPLYDYRTVWRMFTEGTASHVDQAALCRSLVKLMADVFQALSVGMWLSDDKHESLVLAHSTFASGRGAANQSLTQTEAAAAIAFFKANPDPIDIERHPDDWAAALRRVHPVQFPDGGGDRVCVPLIAGGEIVGLITLGDRVSGATFSLQDFDMLKCVGDHAAASLLNVQLSKRLLQSKEMEAFQTMATFFVHDMKNAASTLNLMLQNLPIHFNDPAFREDALRGVSKTVTHMNQLISRLSQLRHELKIQRVPGDLNQVVEAAVATLEAGPNLKVTKELAALPPCAFDRDQLAKVVTNLVLNAREALTGQGEIRVSTRRAGGWVVLGVADNGCGMSPEYLQRSLFRPFQTTKKSGLGIGMFQSKTIVEAHGGRIAVTSEVGKGTTFEVYLPV